jgi:hypothetical protein
MTFPRIAPSPRLAVLATFAGFGLCAGLWAGASSAVIARVGIGATAFGLALTVMTIVYLIGMSSAGLVAARFGVRRALVACLLALGPIVALLVAARSSLWLASALAVYGAVAGLMDAAMNAEGARVEHRSDKPIFAQFHAVASATTAVTAILGSYLAFHDLIWPGAWLVEFALIGAALAVRFAVQPTIDEPRIGGVGGRPRLIDLTIAALGLAIGVSIVCEAAALAWSSLLLRSAAPNLAAFAGLGVTFFAGFQAAMRFQIDRMRRAISDRTLMLASYGIAAVGFLVVAADLGFAASAAGFAIVGIGTGAIVPCGFALAARRPGLSAGLAISAVSFFGLFPRAPAPLLTGIIADAFSLSTAFAGLAALLVIAGVGVAFFVPANQPSPVSKSLAPGGLRS